MEQLDKRLTELEILYSHQVQLIEELNDVVADCNLRIDQLTKENRSMREMLTSLAPEMTESPDE
ncbi:MAG: SlyX family protein [Desulfuromonadales bacterium]|jgi:SlyX protein|nr:SlyX family protein [Desulfuromonadales bacterium]